MKYWRIPLDHDQIQARHYRIHVLKERCKGCGWCIEFCPRQVIRESPELNSKGYHPVYTSNSNDCVDCGLCELICPEFALQIVAVEEENSYG